MLEFLKKLFCRHNAMAFSVAALQGTNRATTAAGCPGCGRVWKGETEIVFMLPEPVAPADPPTLPEPEQDPIEVALHKFAGRLPVEFLRALAYSESRLNPDYEIEKDIDVDTRRLPSGKRDSYWGLFQVGIPNVLADYNERHGTNYEPRDLFDPGINTMMASDTLHRIVDSYNAYASRHGIAALREDWNSIDYVRLVVAGWNSGYSRRSGVQKVALWLHDRGIPVTHDNVFKYAREAGATRFLRIDLYRKKYRWQRGVALRYIKAIRNGGTS